MVNIYLFLTIEMVQTILFSPILMRMKNETISYYCQSYPLNWIMRFLRSTILHMGNIYLFLTIRWTMTMLYNLILMQMKIGITFKLLSRIPKQMDLSRSTILLMGSIYLFLMIKKIMTMLCNLILTLMKNEINSNFDFDLL